MREELYIYFTNDLHSDFNQWPKTAGYLKNMKNKRAVRGDTSVLIDVGDHVDRVHPIAEAFMGKGNIELMNEIGYDVVTIGNNEGITLAHEDLYELYDHANFHVVCANLKPIEKRTPKWLLESKVKTTNSGIRIGYIGLTAPFSVFYELLGWNIMPPTDVLKTQIEALREQTDIIILLSHLGLNEDQAIARQFPEIDLIIGGHTHHLLRNGEYVNNTLLTAAGKHCFYVGEVILTYDHVAGQVVKKEAYTTDVTDYPADESTVNLLHKLEKEASKHLNQEVVTLNETLEADWYAETPLMQALTDTTKEWTNADIALLNAGLILDELPKGPVTYRDLHRICPHPISPVVVQLRGDELIEVIRVSFKKDFMDIPLNGLGFRGKVIGRMVYSGLNITTTIHRDGTETVKKVTFKDGSPVNKQQTYRIATADTFTFGRLLPEIAKSELKQYFLPEFLRDLLLDTLQKKIL